MRLSKSVFHNAYVTILGICLLWIGCGKEGGSHKLKGCCDEPAINATVGNGHLYVPNVFTPNGDQINDFVWVSGDSNILEIKSFQVKDKEGRTVYQVLHGAPNENSIGWNGIVNGKYEEGVYTIVLQAVAGDGTIATLEGKVCNFRCKDDGTEEPISAEGCQFPSQVSDGSFEPLIPNGEPSGCFE